MKYLILILLPLSVHAECFYDTNGNYRCIQTQPAQKDFRGDYNSPKLYENGQYRGNVNNNQFDPNSVSNPYGRYGSQYSPDSINNPYRAR